MKKYNLSKIMKRAWELVRKAGLSISEGLKKAWREAKNIKEKLSGSVKIQKFDSLGISDSHFFTFNLWEKYGKKRVYVNDYKRRTIGYIENSVWNCIDNQGNSALVIENTVADFNAKYEF